VHGASAVTFTDLNPHWVATAERNLQAKIHAGTIQSSQVTVWKARNLREISAEEVSQFDLLVFNPPQLPEAYLDKESWLKITGDEIEKRYRAGGMDGLNIAREFFAWYTHLPLPKPDAVILLSSFIGQRLIHETISQYGLQARGHQWCGSDSCAGQALTFLKSRQSISM
jgi:methylase of polypeptide subunit release factors